MSTRSLSTPPQQPASSTVRRRGIGGLLSKFLAWLDNHAGSDYLALRILVSFLVGLGMVMVMSTSMTWSVIEGSSVWGDFLRQAAMVGIGLLLFWGALKLPPHFVRRFAWLLLGISIALLIAVFIPGVGTGREEVGSQSWIVIGSLRFQPSEVARFAIAIFGASFLGRSDEPQRGWRNRYVIFTAIAIVMIGLIYAEGDLGMAVTFAFVVCFALLFGGIHIGWLIGAGLSGVVVLLLSFFSGGFRSDRFRVYFDALFGHFEDTQGVAFQSYQGFLSLADGSGFGVGLGQSRAKWFYLPEARNDFIFAVIGEELGLWGGAMVIAVFGLMGFFGLRTALRAANRYQSLLAATLTAALVSQAFINIGYVIGLVPVTGIQLPLISAGGTSAIITLASLGLLANVARHEPAAVSAYQSYGRPFFDRVLCLAEPTNELTRPKVARRSAGERRDPRRERFGAPVTERRVPYRGDYHEGRSMPVAARRRGEARPSRPMAPDSGAQRRRNTR